MTIHAERCALLLVASLSLGGCEYFSKTTVPTWDTFPPLSAVSLWFDGSHQELELGQQDPAQAYNNVAFEHVTGDRHKVFLAIAAAWDIGGVREVRLDYRLQYRCIWGPVVTHTLVPWTSQTATQAGNPGDLVDDGLWTAFAIRFADYTPLVTPCDTGGYRMTLHWYARGVDFHGNVSHYGSGRLIYHTWEG